MGIRAGNIGKKTAKPSTLTVGVDEHTNLLVAGVDSELNINTRMVNELETELEALEKEDQSLHGIISQHAHVQDRAQLELKDIEKKMENLKASGNMAAFQKVSKLVKEIQERAAEAEENINKGFDRQDEISQESLQKKGRVKEFKTLETSLLDQKKRLLEFSNRNEPLPEVKVAKKIESGTKIFAANSSMTLYNSNSRCCIREFARRSDDNSGIVFHEMRMGEYGK
jgi:chromosome segregation ATPase